MPTYTVTNSNFNLTTNEQKRLAKGITKVHNIITGANTYFAQVIFNKTKKNNHFMGGKIVKEPSLFLLGQIRDGRSKRTKHPLIFTSTENININEETWKLINKLKLNLEKNNKLKTLEILKILVPEWVSKKEYFND